MFIAAKPATARRAAARAAWPRRFGLGAAVERMRRDSRAARARRSRIGAQLAVAPGDGRRLVVRLSARLDDARQLARAPPRCMRCRRRNATPATARSMPRCRRLRRARRARDRSARPWRHLAVRTPTRLLSSGKHALAGAQQSSSTMRLNAPRPHIDAAPAYRRRPRRSRVANGSTSRAPRRSACMKPPPRASRPAQLAVRRQSRGRELDHGDDRRSAARTRKGDPNVPVVNAPPARGAAATSSAEVASPGLIGVLRARGRQGR